jgi:hypothetical protein
MGLRKQPVAGGAHLPGARTSIKIAAEMGFQGRGD